jgi:hypothetical protein
MLSKDKASVKEYKLLEYFGISAEVVKHIGAVDCYDLAVREAFVSEYGDSFWTDSLRRCVKALHEVSVYRDTPEWEALIDDRVLL